MQYLEFKEQLNRFVLFSIKDIEKIYPNFNKMNLVFWQKKKYIYKIRNGWYRFNKKPENETELYYIANKIYAPSYISFETAMNYYGIIPEAVFTIKSASTLKTQSFKNDLGFFKYSNLKEECFFGYKLISTENFTFKIANIEKTILDFLYFSHSIETFHDIESLRLNRYLLKEKLDYNKLLQYAELYKTKQLLKKIKLLKLYIDD
jgi:predicted transcriptional regulator of viral defense system